MRRAWGARRASSDSGPGRSWTTTWTLEIAFMSSGGNSSSASPTNTSNSSRASLATRLSVGAINSQVGSSDRPQTSRRVNMATQVKMPQLGETVVEGTITRWLKREGESVGMDEPLVEVSTDKVDSEIPSPVSGTVSRIHAGEGETVTVGSVIAEIAGAGEEAPPAAAPSGPKTPEAQEAPAPSASEARGPAAAPPPPPAEKPAAASRPAPPAPAPSPARPAAARQSVAPAARATEVAPAADEPLRGVLSPLVRKLANERGIDLATVRGTGTGGRITKQDVLAAPLPAAEPPAAEPPAAEPAAPAAQFPAPAAAPEPAPAAAVAYAAPSSGGDEVVPVSHMRKSIAEHMVASNIETARAWNAVEVDMTRIYNLRRQAGVAFKEREGFSLTWMPFVAKAVTQALLRYPQVNATWNGDGTITRKHYVNLGIAVALENGLIVPVLKNADGMNLVGLARSIRDLADRARTKHLQPDDVKGGTFTITNPGPFGSIMSVPII